ncbi:NADP-dependent oxidoreductase [Actinacidiphila bryophytorum]|uniref:NADP-dependent oxidoreductase n=1 Tax=Actinacidiphila bryophytorum TaxID=1436133 RepID=A0A9W4MF70_9ACTN|nr:NADP-dependent oxidoreductase [Actinacidiphila bryophytorum]MBM9437289.1 NADP-dependent oxidoreductase [Actinacidiphila bryophytorum]MBN6541961.1 NADP-dependent oxidoreductase [Actinacidiphila bryophytorum]CAG7651458.1 NADP-dependent oxidoreductase [Actinacidiphila bryophytorum]
MRAITQKSFGDPHVLDVTDLPRPEPLPSEVLVRVHAAGVNPIDAAVRSGAFPLIGQPPFVLGWDISGVVEEVVPGVNRFRPGDEVFGMPFFPRAGSGYAEYVAVPSRQLARKPAALDHLQAAALPLAGLTAWQSLVDTARIEPGRRVLIHGGGGGVGHLAVQIAKAHGAHVITTARADKHDFVRGLGADEAVDYRSTDFSEAVRDVDVVLDTVGGDYGRRSIPVLRPGGQLVTAVDRTDTALRAAVESAGRRFAGITVEPDHVGLEALADLAAAARLTPHVGHALPLADAAEAHVLVESGRTRGKIVLTL